MKILYDSDALISLKVIGQPNHIKAKRILRSLKKEPIELFCLNLCLQETATVFSKKYDQSVAKDFYYQIEKNPPIIIDLDNKLEKLAWQIFLQQTKKGTSFIDCANLAAIRLYNLDKIFSFDKFYPKELRLA